MPNLNRMVIHTDWMEKAACKHADRNIFILKKGESAEPAKAICNVCPVLEVCLEYALSNHISIGVWGGKTESQRRKMRRQRRKLSNNE